MADSVPIDLIAREREAGWPTIHPEDYCHRCGARNMLWFTSAETWNVATAVWAAQTGREGICCPACFADLYAEATGESVIWELRLWSPTPPPAECAADCRHECPSCRMGLVTHLPCDPRCLGASADSGEAGQ